MPKFDFVAALEGRKRELLVELLRQRPELTLAELQQLARGELGPLLRVITIADLQGRQVSQAPVRATGNVAWAKSTPGPTTVADVAIQDVDTRTVAGREAFDKKILAAVKTIEGPVSAAQVQARVGGTNMQVRTGLNRLIEVGKLTWSGRAKGTRYHLA
ncbi:hypothetical protein [Nannocystis pusilla]|uniref:hypothetical protein n=1 Tax=Nannocystis pusilla TaxID=889268 RepID=UPI003DA4A3EF